MAAPLTQIPILPNPFPMHAETLQADNPGILQGLQKLDPSCMHLQPCQQLVENPHLCEMTPSVAELLLPEQATRL